EGQELRIAGLCDEPCQRRLAGARRAPEDHRVEMPAFEHPPQRLALAEQMRLPDVVVERRWPHAIRERTCIRRRCSCTHRFLVPESMRIAQPPSPASASVSPQMTPTALAYTSRKSASRPRCIAPCNASIAMPMIRSAKPIIG